MTSVQTLIITNLYQVNVLNVRKWSVQNLLTASKYKNAMQSNIKMNQNLQQS
jgi:hypothetical protein